MLRGDAVTHTGASHSVPVAPTASFPNPATAVNASDTSPRDSVPWPTSLTLSLPTGGGTYNQLTCLPGAVG